MMPMPQKAPQAARQGAEHVAVAMLECSGTVCAVTQAWFVG
jgi:hypothetical protein